MNWCKRFMAFLGAFLLSSAQSFSQGNLYPNGKTPYPIIFVHGLTGSDETFKETMLYLNGGNGTGDYIGDWGPINVFDVVLTADNNDQTSILEQDVKWDDFIYESGLIYRFINVGRRSFADNPDDFNDDWSSSSIFAVNFAEERIRGAHGILNDLFDHSNEAALFKQGYALSRVIQEVRLFTGADKVILIGHSMGGLAIREYLQRTDANGNHRWWLDPSQPDGHKVARVVTIGTPHYGFDHIYILSLTAQTKVQSSQIQSVFPPHLGSEAMRDLSIEVEDTFYNLNFNGPYLFGGAEENAHQNKLSNINFFNKDINCDGDENDYIEGLNVSNIDPVQVKRHNLLMPLPLNVLYTWIVATGPGEENDNVVSAARQYLDDPGDTTRTVIAGLPPYHTDEGSAYDAIIRGMDEPDEYQNAYALELGEIYGGFFTHRISEFDASNDTDCYRILLLNAGYLQVDFEALFGDVTFVLKDENLVQIGDLQNAGGNIEFNVPQGGVYFLYLTKDVSGMQGNHLYYDFRVRFISAPIADFTATPTSGPAFLTVQFTDLSTSGKPITSWLWNFGDGATSTEQNPTHTYAAIGNYTVTLTVSDGTTQDSEAKVNYITVTPPEPKPVVEVSGTLTANTVWTSDNLYKIIGGVTVPQGITLTIQSGTIIKSNGGVVSVYGALIADGTSSELIVFTSLNDDTHGGDTNNDGNGSSPADGNWHGVHFFDSSNDATCLLNYCVIKYGGDWSNGSYKASGIYCENASPTISNCTISENNQNGIWLLGECRSTISGCSLSGQNIAIYCNNSANPIIVNNFIQHNATSEYPSVYNATSTITINAENNYWGHPTGPFHPVTNPNGLGDRVGDHIDYVPWLTGENVGTITGIVSDASTGQPIQGVCVVASGGFADPDGSDANGFYQILYIPVGTGFTVTASAAGYQTSQVADVSVVASQTTTVYLALGPRSDPEVFFEDFELPIARCSFTLNGMAHQDTNLGTLELTGPGISAIGSIFYNTPLDLSSFKVSFDFQIFGGSGGDGMTFTLANSSTPALLGGGGGGLGFLGINGYAVEFDAWQNAPGDGANDPSENHCGISITNGSNIVSLITTSNIPELEDTGIHSAEIEGQNGLILVKVDGVLVINYQIPDFVPFVGFAGFTAANGSVTNHHQIDNVRFEGVTTGTISGRVTDASTGLPIQGANVSAFGGYSDPDGTDANGFYQILNVPAGSGYTLTASATGYQASQVTEVSVFASQITSVNFAIDPLGPDPFTEISTSLTGVWSSSVAWGDYDNDNDLDILLTGGTATGPVTKVYRNEGNGNFVDSGMTVDGVDNGSVSWGDYDNDGDIDILISGGTELSQVTKVYKNVDNTFTETSASLIDTLQGSAAWGDYDNDGDLDILLTGSNGLSGISRLYRNDDGSFVDIEASLADVSEGSTAWGDFDSDGDLDIFFTGVSEQGEIFKLYRNDGTGAFTDTEHPFPGLWSSSIDLGDYNSDGDLDLLLIGRTGVEKISAIYRNDNGEFVDIAAFLPPADDGSVAWGDYDNDGDLDILFTGSSNVGWDARVYRNNNGTFTDIGADLTGVDGSSVAWGDYDNDGDLDILLTGDTGPGGVSIIYRNNIGTANTTPLPPSDINASVLANSVTLSWSKSTDGETSQNGLTYNLRVGTTPGGSEIVSPMANIQTGFRRIPSLGNVNHNDSWIIKNLHPGIYYWSVQAIDNAFAGSEFAEEESFTITSPIPVLSDLNVTPFPAVLSQPITFSGKILVGGVPTQLELGVHDPVSQMSRQLQTNADGTFSFTTSPVPKSDTYFFKFGAEGSFFDVVVVPTEPATENFTFMLPEQELALQAGQISGMLNAQSTTALLSDKLEGESVTVQTLKEIARPIASYSKHFIQEFDGTDGLYWAATGITCASGLVFHPALAACAGLVKIGATGLLIDAGKAGLKSFIDYLVQDPGQRQAYYDSFDYLGTALSLTAVDVNSGLDVATAVYDAGGNLWQALSSNPQEAAIREVETDANGNITSFTIEAVAQGGQCVYEMSVCRPNSQPYLMCYSDSPVDLLLTNPDGLQIGKSSNNIPNASYLEANIDGDPDIEDLIKVHVPIAGNWNITVLPEAGADPTATYSLRAIMHSDTTVLAENVPLQDIPPAPYEVEVNPSLRQYSYAFPQAAWYMISLPAQTSSSEVAALFPGAVAAFGWSINNYYATTEMTPQNGYWLLIGNPSDYHITGTPVSSFTAHYTPGWHLIGNVAEWVDFSSPNDNPDGSIFATFGWNAETQSYVATTILEPGKAYWIATLQECDLTIGGGAAVASAKATHTMNWQEFAAKFGELPPLPPDRVLQEEKPQIPTVFGLSQNYPNPFNPETAIEYQLPEAGRVSLKIYDMMGREVRMLVQGEQPAGYHRVKWDGRNDQGQKLNSGLYLYRIHAGSFVQTRKVVLLK